MKRVFYRSLAFWDWDFWDWVVCSRWTYEKKTNERFESADFHFELWDAYFENIDTVAIIARAQAKTTKVSKSAALYSLCFQLEQSILLIAPKGLGEEIIGDIRFELENNHMLKFLFGELCPKTVKTARGQKWQARELQLFNRCEIKSLSKGEPIRGKRPTKIIVDDPQENKDVKNPIIAQEFYSWMFTTVFPTLADGGSMFVLGTIISTLCFVNMLKQQAKVKGFRVIEYAAILDFDPKKDIEFVERHDHVQVIFKKGRPLWPQRWTLEKLAERCQKMMEEGNDIEKFLQEYCNIPFVLNASPVFKKILKFTVLEPVRKYGTHEIHEYRKIESGKQYALGIDVAHGGIKGDYSTITLRGLDFGLYRQFRGHVPQDILCDVVDEVLQDIDLQQFIIVVESNIATAFFNEARSRPWYDQLYKRVVMDRVTQKETEELGWNTNVKTKILMVQSQQKVYATGKYEVSPELKDEIEHFYHDERGGMNAIAPYHDDLVISDGLCIQGILKGVPDYSPDFV